MIQSKAKIKAKRKKLGDREKELLAEIEKMKTGKNVVITNVMAKMKEEKELVDQNVDAIKIKLEMANKKVNELTPVLEDAKDDVVESFTKGFDAAIDQATFPQGNRLI